MIYKIKLTNGGFCLVDKEDFESISKFKWRRRDETRTSYAFRVQREGKRLKYILMHRFILKPKNPLQEVDHINHNGLDNRRKNIKLCNRAENMLNRRKYRRKNPNNT